MKLFNGILILVENEGFGRERAYDLELLGKSMREWVSLSVGGSPFCVTCRYGEDFVPALADYAGDDAKYTVVLYSDTPLMQRKTVLEAVRCIEETGAQALRLTRGWVFDTEYLRSIEELPRINRYYLSEEEDFLTCADYESFAFVSETMRRRILGYYMAQGVRIVDPSTTYIDGDVVIGKDVVIRPDNHLRGRTVVGDGAELDAGNIITDSIVGARVRIVKSHVTGSLIGEDTTVGPFAYLRKDSMIGANCRIGDYVEIKNSRIGDGTKVCHLTYLGDATLGRDCNIGCGVITANYDGERKFRTEIGDHVFVGSNTTLIAPIKIGGNAFVAAGSTLTDDVEERALAVARERQVAYPDRTKW